LRAEPNAAFMSLLVIDEFSELCLAFAIAAYAVLLIMG
jgi:hypothetical protein